MPAALFLTVVTSVMRARATADLIGRPEEILRQINELLIPQNAAILHMTRLTYATGGLPFEYALSAYCGVRYKFNAVLKHV